MISAFARAARVFEQPHYAELAATAAKFILTNMRDANGRLLRRYRDGEAGYKAYLCDYAQLANACLDLYEYSYDLEWFHSTVYLMNEVNRLFRNNNGPYFDTGIDSEPLILRAADGYDGVEPSGNSSAALVFLKLRAFGLDLSYQDDAERILGSFLRSTEPDNSVNYAALQLALHFLLSSPKQVVIVGPKDNPETTVLLDTVRKGFYPDIICAFVPTPSPQAIAQAIPITMHRHMIDGKATAYVCQNNTCQMPLHSAEALKKLLDNKCQQ